MGSVYWWIKELGGVKGVRLFTALLKEWHEDWISGRAYLNMDLLKEFELKKRLHQQERAPAGEPNIMTQKTITVAL